MIHIYFKYENIYNSSVYKDPHPHTMISEKKQIVEVLKINACKFCLCYSRRPKLTDLIVTWIAKPYT
jgi:hypothetical protein